MKTIKQAKQKTLREIVKLEKAIAKVEQPNQDVDCRLDTLCTISFIEGLIWAFDKKEQEQIMPISVRKRIINIHKAVQR